MTDRELRKAVRGWAIIGVACAVTIGAAVAVLSTPNAPPCGDIYRNSFEWNQKCEFSK